MSLGDTIGITPEYYHAVVNAWIIKGATPHAIKHRAEQIVRMERSNFSIAFDRDKGFEVSFVLGQDIYECMWVCTQLHWIFKVSIQTSMNGTTIEWRETWPAA